MKFIKSIAALLLISFSLNAQIIKRSELLGQVTDASISIQMMFSDSVEAYVEYGPNSGALTNSCPMMNFYPDSSGVFTIAGLTPNTKYYYRVQCRHYGTGAYAPRPEYTFHTQRPIGSSFTFDIQADPHMDTSSDAGLYARCLQNQLEDQPDFMIDLGDVLMTDKLKNAAGIIPYDTIPYRCDLMRSFYEQTCHSVPLFMTLGNHEGEAGWLNNGTANCIPVWSSNLRKKYFLNPLPNNFYSGDTTNLPFIGQRDGYYSWQWGDALFIVIDPYWFTNPKPDATHGWYWTLGETQYNWLKNTLQNSTAQYKFVFSHQLVGGDPQGRGGIEFADFYEWGGKNIDSTQGFAANRPGWYKPIKDLLTENRVTVFFHGHDHFYGQQKKDCLIYQETPQPSLPNFNFPNFATAYGYLQGVIVANSGHLRVNVSPNGVQVDYVRAYRAQDTSATRHNKDISATYFIGPVNCYDSLSTGSPIIWNNDYANEIVYPNPFSSETAIDFTVNNQDNLSLSIYSIEGKLVRRLIDDNKLSNGNYKIIWDGCDGKGNKLTSGTYVYKFKGDNLNNSGKIILKY